MPKNSRLIDRHSKIFIDGLLKIFNEIKFIVFLVCCISHNESFEISHKFSIFSWTPSALNT